MKSAAVSTDSAPKHRPARRALMARRSFSAAATAIDAEALNR
jgi:hypothetical protein